MQVHLSRSSLRKCSCSRECCAAQILFQHTLQGAQGVRPSESSLSSQVSAAWRSTLLAAADLAWNCQDLGTIHGNLHMYQACSHSTDNCTSMPAYSSQHIYCSMAGRKSAAPRVVYSVRPRRQMV